MVGILSFCFSCTVYCLSVSELDTVVTTLTVIGKAFVAGAFIAIYVFTAEVFPTEVRNSAFGSCAAGGRIGSIIATFVGKELVSFSFLLSHSSLIMLYDFEMFMNASVFNDN